MKKFSILFVVALAVVAVKAQSLSPTVIASTGGFSSNGTNSLSYTVGEMTMIETFGIGTANILTQGFQQPNELPTGLIDITQDAFGSFVVYPNPAVDNYYFGYQMPEAGRVSIVLYDELGQKIADVYQANYQSGQMKSESDVSGLAAGTYFVSMTFTSAVDGKTHVTTKKLQVIR